MCKKNSNIRGIHSMASWLFTRAMLFVYALQEWQQRVNEMSF